MAIFRVALEFEAFGDQDAGWSETYWGQFTAIGQAVYGAAALATNRAAALADSVNIPWARVSAFPPGTGQASLVNLRRGGAATASGSLVATAGYQTVKGLMRLVNSAGGYTKQPLGGIPSVCFGSNGVYDPQGPFPAGFQQFIAFLASPGGDAAGPYCTRKISQAAMPYPVISQFAKFPISSITAAGVVTAPGSTYAVGQSVKLGRVPGGFGLRKTWVVATVPVAGSYTFVGFPPLAAAVIPGPAAYTQQIVYQFTPIVTGAVPGISVPAGLITLITRSSKHAVGRPSALPSGRRKRRVT